MDWLGRYDPAAVVIRAGQDSALLDQLGEIGKTLQAIVKASAKKSNPEQEGLNQGSDYDPNNMNKEGDDPRQLLEDFDLAGVLAVVWGGNGDPILVNQLRVFASNLSRYVNLAKGVPQGREISTRTERKHPVTVEGPSPGKDLIEREHSDDGVVPPQKKHKGQVSHSNAHGAADKSPGVNTPPRGEYWQAKILNPLVEHTARQLMDKEAELQAAKQKLELHQRESTESNDRSDPHRNQILKESNLNRPGGDQTGGTRPVFTGDHNSGGRYATMDDRHGGTGEARHCISSKVAVTEPTSDLVAFSRPESTLQTESLSTNAGGHGSGVSGLSGKAEGHSAADGHPSGERSELPAHRSDTCAPSNVVKSDENSRVSDSLVGGKEEARSAFDGVDSKFDRVGRHDTGTRDEEGRAQGEIPARNSDHKLQTKTISFKLIKSKGSQPEEVVPFTDTAKRSEQAAEERAMTDKAPDNESTTETHQKGNVDSAPQGGTAQGTLGATDKCRRNDNPNRVDGVQRIQVVTGFKGPGQYQASRNFEGDEKFDKISFSQGDIVTIDGTKLGSGNWVWGTVNKSGKSGWCPQHYLVPLHLQSATPTTKEEPRMSPTVPTTPVTRNSWDEDPDTFDSTEPVQHRKTTESVRHQETTEPLQHQETSAIPAERSGDRNTSDRPEDYDLPSENAAASAVELGAAGKGPLQESVIERHLKKAVTVAETGLTEQGEHLEKHVVRYEAMRDYKGDSKACKLTFTKGDIIIVDNGEADSGNWLWGNLCNSGRGGWCPKSLLRSIDSPESISNAALETAHAASAGKSNVGDEFVVARASIRNLTESPSKSCGIRENIKFGPADQGMGHDASRAEGLTSLEVVGTEAGYNVYRTPSQYPIRWDADEMDTPPPKGQYQITPVDVGPTLVRRFFRIDEVEIQKSPGLTCRELSRCSAEMGLGVKFSLRPQISFTVSAGTEPPRIHYIRTNGGICELPPSDQYNLKLWVLKKSAFPDFPSDEFMEFGWRPDRPAVPIFHQRKPPHGKGGPPLYHYIGDYRCVKVENFGEHEYVKFKGKRCQACLHLELLGCNGQIMTAMENSLSARDGRRPRRDRSRTP